MCNLMPVPGSYVPPLERRLSAYLSAAATAELTFMVVIIFVAIFGPWIDGKVSNPFRSDRLLAALLATLFASLLYGIAVVVITLPACIVAERLSGWLGVRGAWYFVMWATLTAVALAPGVLALHADHDMPRTWMARYWRILPPVTRLLAPQGALCGLVYWWVSRGSRTARASLVQENVR